MGSFEQKYCIGTNDGKYQVFWDIAALVDELKKQHLPIYNIDVKTLFKNNSFNGDCDYAMTTNTEVPCIIVELNKEVKKLIDGNHRLYKANQLSLKTVPCYILPFDYHKRFIINYDIKVYEKVIADFR